MGECGLDYSRLPEDEIPAQAIKDRQMNLFKAQLEFAADRILPTVIHCRDAYADLLALHKSRPDLFVHGAVVHCFTGNLSEAEALAAAGFYFGITGIVTFPKAEALRAAVGIIPAEQLLIETDCPYLAPVPHRGEVNYPKFVVDIGKAVAEIRGTTPEAIAALTLKNAQKLFSLPDWDYPETPNA
jgi:TatD DNase family protein